MKNNFVFVLAVSAVFFTACSSPKPELIGDLPFELESKLIFQEGHIPYYFPEREEFGDLADGVYTGVLSGGMIDRGEVTVTISDNKISDVTIDSVTLWAPTVRKEKRLGEIYDGLPSQVIVRQSPLVDSVSAATGTTHVFKICVTRALWMASQGSDPLENYNPY